MPADSDRSRGRPGKAAFTGGKLLLPSRFCMTGSNVSDVTSLAGHYAVVLEQFPKDADAAWVVG
jgi:hypothetical protein